MLCRGVVDRSRPDLAESHGLPTAIRLAAGKAALRKRGRRMVAMRRHLVELYRDGP
jgi:hypothetical protein